MTELRSDRHHGAQAGEDQIVHYHLDRSEVTYLYGQVADHLAERISSGDLVMNRRLPAEMQLARQYGVSLGTARRATEILRARGLVVTLRSKGTYVVARPTDDARGTTDGPEPGWLNLAPH